MRDALDVVGHREGVEGAQAAQPEAPGEQGRGVAREGGGVARDVGDGPRPQVGDGADDRRTGPRARRVEDDDVGAQRDERGAHRARGPAAAPVPLRPGQPEHLVDPARDDGHRAVAGEVGGGAGHGVAVGLDGDDLPPGPGRLGECGREQADAGVQVEGPLPRPDVERAP